MYLFLIIFSLLSIFPLYYMVCAATNMSVDVIRGKLIPGTYLLENYKSLIANQNLYRALWNSFRNSVSAYGSLPAHLFPRRLRL